MKLSRKWLNEFIDLPITEVGDRAFAEAMSVSGSKVEATDDLTRSISGVICARVLSLEKHPDSDHMFVAQLDAGPHGVYQVVTGAWNVHQGDLVPLAVAGAHLMHRWNSDLLRILLGAGMVTLILLTGKNVYTEAGYEVATNPEKLTQGVVDVADAMLALDAKPKCFVRDRYLIEIRQYSGNIELYYGRDIDGYIIRTTDAKKKVQQMIESDFTRPEVYEELIKRAYSNGYDFIVVHISNPIPPEIAGKYGYRIIDGIDGSTIYYCPELCREPATKKAARERKQAIKDAKVRKAGLREAARAAKEAEELAQKGLSNDDGTAQLWG